MKVTFDVQIADGQGKVVFDIEDKGELFGRVVELDLPPEVEKLWQDLTVGGNPKRLVIGGGQAPGNILQYFDGVSAVLSAIDKAIIDKDGLGMIIESDARVGSFKGSERGSVG